VSKFTWEAGVAAILYPLSLIRNYSVFAFTSALGVFAVMGGILITLASGIYVDPGGGLAIAIEAIESLRMWPESLANAFGGSFGTIAYLFCVNFLSFPTMNSMREPEKFGCAVGWAVSVVWIVNVIFAILCLGFYGDATQDLVLTNLDNGPYLSALKLLLCIDLLFTFPIVLENAMIGSENVESEEASVPRYQYAYTDFQLYVYAYWYQYAYTDPCTCIRIVRVLVPTYIYTVNIFFQKLP
jgi:proton-coupled amino acid transporter